MSNGIRLSGLATGMDTETMVKQLMKPYNMKVDKMKQEKQTMQWKQEIMRDMIKELRGLKNNYLNIDSPDTTNMIKAGTFSVASITSSNDGVLTATAMPGAVDIPSKVSVKQIAKPAKMSIDLNLANKEKPLSTKLTEIGFENGEIIELKYGDKSFSLKIVDKVGENEQGTIGKDETVQDLMNRLNSIKVDGVGTLYEKVKISFSELTGSLSFETRDTGNNQSLSMSFIDVSNTSTPLGKSNGQDTIVNITPLGSTNPIEVSRSSNEFTIDNVKYSLNQNAVISGPMDVNLTSKADAQKSVDKVKGFVEKYNAIVDKIYAKYSEKKQYKFLPLTEEQRKDMKEDEIKKWEDKAKEGIIKGDEALGSMLNAMRTALFTPVEGSGISLKDIGLDSYSGIESTTKPGQIKIADLTKLKTALETRGDQVMNLFAGAPDKSITDDKTISEADRTKKIYNNTGVFNRLNDILNNYVGKTDAILLKKAGIEGTFSSYKNDLTEKMKKKDQAISQMERKMSVQEERYYKKFAQLEKAMNALNSQSNWLTSQLGGGK